jgi:hypothetical protein
MTVFLTNLQALKAALLAAPALAGSFVNLGRATPLPEGKSQGIWLRPGRAIGTESFAGDTRTDWDSEVLVAMAARATAGSDGVTAVDALLTAVYARVAAAAPPAASFEWLGQPALAWDVDEADQTLGACELRLRFKHRTASGSLAAAD